MLENTNTLIGIAVGAVTIVGAVCGWIVYASRKLTVESDSFIGEVGCRIRNRSKDVITIEYVTFVLEVPNSLSLDVLQEDSSTGQSMRKRLSNLILPPGHYVDGAVYFADHKKSLKNIVEGASGRFNVQHSMSGRTLRSKRLEVQQMDATTRALIRKVEAQGD
jgi:hypothetical protein